MKTSKILAGATSVFSSLYLASAAFAAPATTGDAEGLLENVGGTGQTDLMTLIYNLINWAIGIAALVCAKAYHAGAVPEDA